MANESETKAPAGNDDNGVVVAYVIHKPGNNQLKNGDVIKVTNEWGNVFSIPAEPFIATKNNNDDVVYKDPRGEIIGEIEGKGHEKG